MGIGHRQLATHSFAILNPLQVDPTHWQHFRVESLAPPSLSSQRDCLPWVLDLAALTESERISLLVLSDEWDRDYDFPIFSALLQSNSSTEQVVAHLSRCLITTAQDRQKTLLRWYDPRVFRHLRWLLSPTQLRTLAGPVTAWTWRDNVGQWHIETIQSDLRSEARLRLTEAQWDVIGRMGVLNRTLSRLRRTIPEFAETDTTIQRIDALLRQAYRERGMVNETDARLYVEQAIRHGDAVHCHPLVVNCLDAASRGETTYVGACIGIDFNALGLTRPERATS